MRTPTALDAMARWLVLTLAGVGLFALIPGSSFAAPSFTSTRWLLSLHPVQVVALAMMGLAWLLFVVHVAQLADRWIRDPMSLTLAVLALTGVVLFVVACTWGRTESLVGAFLLAIGLHVVLCVRVDWVGQDPARVPRTHTPRKRRAATAQ